MLSIEGRQIKRVWIVDDEPDARDAYEYTVEDMRLPSKQVEKIHNGDLREFIGKVQPTDAILCDFHLTKRDYASQNGDSIIARCFRAGIPGALCTSFHDAPIKRNCLRYIPGLLRKSNPSPTELEFAWKRSIQELAGKPQPSRRPWRTLVRVDVVDNERQLFYAVVPAWNTRTKVGISMKDIPENIKNLVEPDQRFHALVNTGATNPNDLFFDEWEDR